MGFGDDLQISKLKIWNIFKFFLRMCVYIYTYKHTLKNWNIFVFGCDCIYDNEY